MTHERNDDHSALSERDPLAGGFRQKEGPRTSPDGRDAGEAKQFFPEALLKDERGIAPLGIDVVRDTKRPAMGSTESEADSDRYGQPSPREGSAERTTATPFSAGYGEVPYGLQEGDQERPSLSESQDPETAPPTSAASTEVKDKKPYFQVRVGDPQKVGDPVTAHIVYTVRIKTDSQLFKSTTFSVLRRYSDFRWLHAALVHNNPGIFIPPVPEKVRSGRFAPDLVEARRHGLESCVNKIANNAILQLDEDFRLFLESQNFHADVKARDQVKGPVPTPEQKSYFGWSTSFTGTTYRYREQDEWFEEQKVYLDHLEMHLKSLVRIVSTLAQQRKDVALATSESSHALMMLSGSSLSRSLSTCFAGLGEVQRRTFELADTQADADIREFGSVLYEFERMVGSARKAFATRLDAWQTWQRLEDETKKVRVKHEKVKKDMQPGSHKAHDGGRLQAVLDELATAETRCLNAKREFDIIGRRCKEQMDLFEGDRIDTFHEACEVWLQGMLERNQEIMAEWEQYASLLERQTGQKVI
jgi:sorting nexin-1/2